MIYLNKILLWIIWIKLAHAHDQDEIAFEHLQERDERASYFGHSQPGFPGTKTHFIKKINDGLKNMPFVKFPHVMSTGLTCVMPPAQIPQNAILNCNSASRTCQAECLKDYQFPNQKTKLILNCVNGEWQMAGWSEMPNCAPVCNPSCKNNGICSSPGVCSCPENFFGPQCQQQKKLCIGFPETISNSRRSCSSSKCTVTCMTGYRFPDETSIANLECVNGEWKPTRSDWQTLPGCKPTCTPQCQNGGSCMAFNVCSCPNQYAGPQCQYDINVCSHKKLAFNGGVSCSGNGDYISCTITCPENTQFAYTPATEYICYYSRGEFLPRNVPKCVYGSNMDSYSGDNPSKMMMVTGQTHTGLKTGTPMKTYSNDVETFDPAPKTGGYNTKTGIKSPTKPRLNQTDRAAMPGVYYISKKPNVIVAYRKPKPATCTVWGANKVKTFDGIIYNAMLYCSHTLVHDRIDGTFSIVLRSCAEGTANGCSPALNIFLQGKQYTIESDGNNVTIFNQQVHFPIPVQLASMKVALAGHEVSIHLADIQISIFWDRENYVNIEASAGLWNRTSGLCGTLDMDPYNEFLSKSDAILKLPSTFTDSWKTSHLDQPGDNCQSKSPNDLQLKVCDDITKVTANKVCNQLLSNPKLQQCLQNFDVALLRQSCLADYCQCTKSEREKCACDGISVLAKDCKFENEGFANDWRDMEVCPVKCPNGRFYSSCGPNFEPSCGSAEKLVNDKCREGCFCPTGTIQHEGNCIVPEMCPCKLRGKTFKPGTQIKKDCNTCKCEKGSWKCSDISCGSRCGTIGDPHYSTFDGKRYDFMGKCAYYLLKTDNITIEAENVACPGALSESMIAGKSFDHPSCTRSVTIKIKEDNGRQNTIGLKQGQAISVNGMEVKEMPTYLMQNAIQIRQLSSTFIVVEFNDGLALWWDGVTRVYVDAPSSYRGKTMGLCGTFNSNLQDDFLTPEGDIESSVESFVDKWRTSETCPHTANTVPHACQKNFENKPLAEKHCAAINGKHFEDCHWAVDPTPYYEDCMYDVCACEKDIGACMCPIFGAYANECARQGVILNWRYSMKECEIQCPAGQVYSECGNGCTRSCEDLSSTTKCRTTCVEGCHCPSGQALDRTNECVPVNTCPCKYKGLVFQPGYKETRPGQKFLELCKCTNGTWTCDEAKPDDAQKYPQASDLKKKCLANQNEEFTTCEPADIVTCKNMHLDIDPSTPAECRPGCVCKKGFVFDMTTRACVLPENCSCHHGGKSYNENEVIFEDCNSCTCKAGNWICSTKECAATCTVWGDSHFETFDGKTYDFQGVCSYILSKGSLPDGNGYSITIQNVLCGSLGVTCSKSLQISISGIHAEVLNLSPDIPIPGMISSDKTSATKKEETNKLLVHPVGTFIVVEMPGMGFQVKWDRGTRVYVTLSKRWKSKAIGLCGNNNGNALDDFTTPSSGIEASPELFGHAWKVQESCAVPTVQIDSCQASPHRRTWAELKCGLLKSKVFQSCHSEVPVEQYLKRCIYDSCGCDQGGDCECLCTAIAAYATACTNKGVVVKWRTPDMCPMQCDPTCSNYSPCVSPCPVETCDTILDQAKEQRMCKDDYCVEGCELKKCEPDQIFLNSSYSECVPKSVCSPVCMEVNGVVYKEGDIIREDGCQTCRCSRKKEICSGAPCTTIMPLLSTTALPTEPPMHEEKLKCVPGWTNWINQDLLDLPKNQKTSRTFTTRKTLQANVKDGDVEPIPNFLVIKNMDGSAVCRPDQIHNIECRTVSTKSSPKATGQNVECSIERGLVCVGECSDYEIRVLCVCDDPVMTTTPTTKTTLPKGSKPTKQPIEILFPPTEQPKHAKSACDPTIPHVEVPGDCFKFLHCQPMANGDWQYVEKTCGPSMMFNPQSMVCDWPYSVTEIKPNCGLAVTEKPVDEQVTETGSNWCPPGKVWSNCAVPCGRACNFYSFSLYKAGLCTAMSNECIAGCVEMTAKLTCDANKFWRDANTCVELADCPCMSDMGDYVKPGKMFEESECKMCQCIDNTYTCDVSLCEHKNDPVTKSFKYDELIEEKPTTPLPMKITSSTVTPPLPCSPKSFKPLIEGAAPLPDSSLTASSVLGNSFLPHFARLHSRPNDVSSGAWSPAQNDQMQYLQIALPKVTPLFGVVISGSPIFDQYVTRFKILHSNDGQSFFYLEDEQKVPQLFNGPMNSQTPVESAFKVPIEAKYLRIYPLTWVRSIAMRVEILGCDRDVKTTTAAPTTTTPATITTTARSKTTQKMTMNSTTTMRPATTTPTTPTQTPTKISTKKPVSTTVPMPAKIVEAIVKPMCEDPMGLEASKMSPDQVSVSSVKQPGTKNRPPKPFDSLKLSSPTGWQPSVNSPNEFILFDFLEPRNLTGVKTKGGPNGWVTAYNVEYSIDNNVWNSVLSDDGQPKIFLANVDTNSPKENLFKNPIKARYLKISPLKWEKNIEMRTEILGCYKPYPVKEKVEKVEDVPVLATQDCGLCDGVKAPTSSSDCKCTLPSYWNGEKCTPQSQCPCVVGHIPYPVGASFEKEDCQQCVCVLGGVSKCKPLSCPPCGEGLRPVVSATCLCMCEPCPPDTRICPSSGACVAKSDWCNGIDDCGDDEADCYSEATDKPVIPEKTIAIVKPCKDPSCPPGFKVQVKEAPQTKKKQFSPLFKTSVKTNMKTSYLRSASKRKKTTDTSKFATPSTKNIVDDSCINFECTTLDLQESIDEQTTNVEVVTCQEASCPPGYNKVIEDDFSPTAADGCARYSCEPVPKEDAICNVTGKTFNTFDGTTYKMDICSHMLVRDFVDKKWIIIINKNCTNPKLTCRTQLLIEDHENGLNVVLNSDLSTEIDGHSYTLQQLKSSKIVQPTFTISNVGNTILFVSLMHGFWISYDKGGDIKVGVSKTYLSKVDGLCGFMNEDPADDKMKPNGELAFSTENFGDSWSIRDTDETACEPSKCSQELLDKAWAMCEKISLPVFAPCAGIIDSTKFISKCVEVACDCLKDSENSVEEFLEASPDTCKCTLMESYVQECMAIDSTIQLETWRAAQGCESLCEEPLVQKDCFRRKCEPTCDTLHADECPYLTGTCFSGCYCPEGMVRKGETCIPISDCRDCVCDVFGKSQFVTYDQRNFTFNGDCTYLLSRDLIVPDVYNFQVFATFEPCEDSKDIPLRVVRKAENAGHSSSCPQSLHIIYGDHIVHLQKESKGKYDLIIDGIKLKKLAYKSDWLVVENNNGNNVKIVLPSSHVEIATVLENMAFSIRVPSLKYSSNMEGLCGNCNNDPKDDLTAKKSTKPTNKKIDPDSISDFVASWAADDPKLELDDEECTTEEMSSCMPLPPDQDPCMKMVLDEAFGSCLLAVDPGMYISSCQQDMCRSDKGQLGACETIAAYARECAKNGFCIDWRSKDFCDFDCPINLEYNACGCADTCDAVELSALVQAPATKSSSAAVRKSCKTQVEEGCFCPEDKIMHNNKCIEPKACKPCDKEGHLIGDKWYPDKCSTCTCLTDGKIQCSKKTCADTVCQKGFQAVTTVVEDECCKKVICVPEPKKPLPVLCAASPQPVCGPQQVKKLESGTDQCPKFICECKPKSECEPLRKSNNTLAPGMKEIVETSGCCPISKLICDKSTCPVKPKNCTDQYFELIQIVTPKDACCDEYKCEQPKDTCLVPTVDGKKVLKKVNDKWLTEDPCIVKECIHGPGSTTIVKNVEEKCNVECADEFELKVPKGQCCGTCVQTRCKMNDKYFTAAQTWYSPDNCTSFMCMEHNGRLDIISSVQKCPDISDCPEERRFKKDCCDSCRPASEDQKDCVLEPLRANFTVGLIAEKIPRHGQCKNFKPIAGFKQCTGACKSGTEFNTKTMQHEKKCDCCNVSEMGQVTVLLACEDGFTYEKKIPVPLACSCRRCDGDSAPTTAPAKKGKLGVKA